MLPSMPRGSLWAGASALSTALLVSSAAAQSYTLADEYSAKNWFDKFDFFTADDPTGGFVQYVNESYATSNGLVGNKDDRIYVGVDHKNKYDVHGPGRPSVRLHSKQVYNHGLFILDLNHMPVGCGTWPAWWTLGEKDEWPRDGEIDIIEGVNKNLNNTNKIYTDSGCSITGKGQTAIADSFNCAAGCGSASTRTDSYGDVFNDGHGGVYAMEWTSHWVRVWFFPRSSIPTSIGSSSPDISEFGTPMANFQGDCDIDEHFRDHTIILDITFCGDWAGSTFGKHGCPMTSDNAWESCNSFVAQSPESFTNAYWDINSMRVYQQDRESGSSSDAEVSISDAVRLSSSVIEPLSRSSSSTASVTPAIPTTPVAFAETSNDSPTTPSKSSNDVNPSSASVVPVFTSAFPQPCYFVTEYDGPIAGFRHGIGDMDGSLAMCQSDCAELGLYSCSDVLFVHYEPDSGSPLGYWDCWFGVLYAKDVVCPTPWLGSETTPAPASTDGASPRKRAVRHLKRQETKEGINMLPSPNIGVRTADYQVLMHTSDDAPDNSSSVGSSTSTRSQSSVSQLSSSETTSTIRSQSTSSSKTSSTIRSQSTTSQLGSSETSPTRVSSSSSTKSEDILFSILAGPAGTLSRSSSESPKITPSIITPSTLRLSTASASFLFTRSSSTTTSSVTLSKLDPELIPLHTETSASSEMSHHTTFVPDFMPPKYNPNRPAPSPDSKDTSTPSLRAHPRPAWTPNKDASFSSRSSSSLSADPPLSLGGWPFTVPLSAYTAARSAATVVALAPPRHSNLARPPGAVRPSGESSGALSSDDDFIGAPTTTTTTTYLHATVALGATPSSSASEGGDGAIAKLWLPGDDSSALSAYSTAATVDENGNAHKTLFWGQASQLSPSSRRTVTATVTVTVTTKVYPEWCSSITGRLGR